MIRKVRSQRLNGLFPLSYMGVVPVSPPNFVIDERSPTTNDSQNFYLGDIWLRHLPPIEEIWMLVDLQQNIATWVQLFPGSGGGATTFPANVGVATEAGGILNILGDVTNILTTGAGNTITITIGGDVATTYVEDVGAATPAANILKILGAGGIATSGAGNTVTITQGANVPLEFDADVGMAIPAFNILNIFGDGIVTNTTAAGNTVTIHGSAAVATSYVEDVGVAVPVANVLKILGAGGVATSGAGNIVTISGTAAVPLQFTEDAGVAVPAANNLNVFGGAGIATSGAGSTVTIATTGTVATQYTTDAGIAVPAAHNLNVLGGAGITTTGAGSTITIINTSPGGGVAGQPFFAYLNYDGITANEVANVGISGYYSLGTNYLWTELYDVGGNFDPGGGHPMTFTAPATGYYWFYLQVFTGSSGQGILAFNSPNTPVGFLGTHLVGQGGANSGVSFDPILQITSIIFLNIGETTTFQAQQNGPGNMTFITFKPTLGAQTVGTYVMGYRIA